MTLPFQWGASGDVFEKASTQGPSTDTSSASTQSDVWFSFGRVYGSCLWVPGTTPCRVVRGPSPSAVTCEDAGLSCLLS